MEAPAGQMGQMFSFVFFLARFENTRQVSTLGAARSSRCPEVRFAWPR